MRDRPVFVSGVFRWLPRGTRAVPWHLAYWLRPEGGDYAPESAWTTRLELWTGRTDAYLGMVAWMFGNHRLERARYEAEHGRIELARSTEKHAGAGDERLTPPATLPRRRC